MPPDSREPRPPTASADAAAPQREHERGERYFREIAEHLDTIFWVSAADRRSVLYASPAFERVFGRSREDLYRDVRLLADAIHPDDRAAAIKRALLQSGGDHEIEYRIVRPDGSVRWIHGRAFPVHDASGGVVRIADVSQDVTERKRLELELRGRNRVLEQLTLGVPLERVLATAVQAAEAVNPGLLCSVLLLQDGRLRHGAAPSLPAFYVEAIDGLRVGPGMGSCGTAAYTGELVIAEDVLTHPHWTEFRELATRAGLRACWSHPIVASSGEVLGTFAMYYREPRAPSPAERAYVETTARLVGLAIERRRAEEALRRSERNLSDAQRVAHLGSWEWHVGHDAISWSEEMYRIAGMRPDEFDGTYESFLACVHPDDRKYLRESVEETLERGYPYEIECRLVQPDGAIRYIVASAQLERDADGRPLRMVGVTQDVTERRLAEDSRRGLEAQMRQSQQLESLGVLAGGIAHDFNNLLSVILGNAGLALDDLERGAAPRDKLQRVRETAQYAAELVDQILTYSGKPSPRLERLDLSSLVSGMLALLRSSVSDRCVLEPRLPDDLPPIEGDATQIRQIVLNLVTNASEALKEVGGRVELRTGAIEADAAYLARTIGSPETPPGDYVFLEVRDDGTGMDPSIRARVFDPFFTTKFSGRGLGLAALLGIVRAHRGAVELESEPGVGTRFRVLVPRAPTAQLPARTPVAHEAVPTHGACVLAVDDEVWVLEVAREFLERAGYRVLTAGGGRAALERFREHADEIDAVVLDVAMPDVDGPETFEAMRRLRPDLPVVLVSGYNQELATRRFARAGAARFVRKPYDPEDLVRALREVLER